MKLTKVIIVILFANSLAAKGGRSQSDNSETYDQCSVSDINKTIPHVDVVKVYNGTRLTLNCHNCSCDNVPCWEVNGGRITDSFLDIPPHYYSFSQTLLNVTGQCNNMFTMTAAADSDSFPFYLLAYCTESLSSDIREKICTRNVTAYIILIVIEDESPEPPTTELDSPTSNSSIADESTTGMASTTTTTLTASTLTTSMSTTSSNEEPTKSDVDTLKETAIPSLLVNGVLIAFILLLIVGMISVYIYYQKRKKNEQNDNGVRNVGYYEENRQNPAELTGGATTTMSQL